MKKWKPRKGTIKLCILSAAISPLLICPSMVGRCRERYREYIEDIRKSFQNLDSLIAGVDNLEGGEIDASRVKSWFYALYFGEEQPSRRAQKDFLECFLRYEERTREVEEEDGSITEETYTVAIFLTDQEEICRNLESLLGRSLAMETRANAQRIYTTAVYGRGAWQLCGGRGHGGWKLRGAVRGGFPLYRLSLCVGRLFPGHVL